MPWQFDPSHSQVEFACEYLGLSIIKGFFLGVRADVDVASADPGQWSVAAEVDVSTLASTLARREEALRSPNFLDAERFPIISFTSKAFERQGDRLRLTGDLTVHGVTREVTLSGKDNGEATDRQGVRRRGFNGSTVLRRSDFEVGPPGPGGVAQDVRIALEIQLIQQD